MSPAESDTDALVDPDTDHGTNVHPPAQSISDTFSSAIGNTFADTTAHVNADAGSHSDTRSDAITGSDRYPRLPLLCGTSGGIRERRL